MVEDRRRIHRTEGRILDAETGEEIATAEATYVAATGAKKAELKALYGVPDGGKLLPPRPSDGAGAGDDGARDNGADPGTAE